LRHIVATLADRKAVDTIVLDLHGLSEATDYFVIA
jgi:ribosomal silencing factor RsfS